MPLSAEVTADLIAIRSLRDFAVHQASVPGAVHRQVAVILLDAAIEQTAFTAAEYLGASFADRDQVEKPLQKLRELKLTVNNGVETSRKRLHRARNVVQHAGVGVDPEDLPRWAQATRRFIGDVIAFAYGVDLDVIRYSAAIENAEVRMHLDAAEALIDTASTEAMQSILSAYDIVIGIWRGFFNAVDRDLEPRSGHHTDFGTIGGDDPKVVALQAVTLLTSIAPDPGEAVWFLDAKGQPEYLLADEVRRALLFVFSLTVAVEASPAALREDRRHRTAVTARNTRGNPADQVTLGSYELERSGLPGWGVRFVLHNVPEPDLFDEWHEVVADDLRDSDDDWHFYIDDNGTLSGSGPEEKFEAALNRLEGVLGRSEASVAEHRERLASEAFEKNEIEAEFASAVVAATPPGLPEWFKLGTAENSLNERAPVVTVEIGELWRYGNEVRAAFDAAGHWAYISTGWVVPELTPAEIPDFVGKLIPELEAVRAKQVAETSGLHESQQPMVDLLTRHGYLRAPADRPARGR